MKGYGERFKDFVAGFIPDDLAQRTSPYRELNSQHQALEERVEIVNSAMQPILDNIEGYVKLLNMQGYDIDVSDTSNILLAGVLAKVVSDSMNYAKVTKKENRKLRMSFQEYKRKKEDAIERLEKQLQALKDYVSPRTFCEVLRNDAIAYVRTDTWVVVATSKALRERGYGGNKLEYFFAEPHEFTKFKLNVGKDMPQIYNFANDEESQEIEVIPVKGKVGVEGYLINFGMSKEPQKEGIFQRLGIARKSNAEEVDPGLSAGLAPTQ